MPESRYLETHVASQRCDAPLNGLFLLILDSIGFAQNMIAL